MKPKCDQNVTLKIFQIHQFRTSRPESLLVLVAGKTDYCLIMLQQGMLKVLLRRLHQPKDKTDNAPTLDVEASFPVFTTWGWRSPPEILLLNPFNILTVKPGAYKPRSWGVWGFVPKRISSRWSSMAHCQASQVRMLFMTFLIQHISHQIRVKSNRLMSLNWNDHIIVVIIFCRTEADIELIIDEEQISRWVNTYIWHLGLMMVWTL